MTKEFEEAVKKFRSKAELAKKLGVSPQCLSNWISRKSIPVDRCRIIEKVTGVSRKKLRPDIFG